MERISSDEKGAFDFGGFHARMGEHQKWAELRITLQEASGETAALCRDMATFDAELAVPMISALLTIPEYQSNCIRIELLVALALVHCKGHKTPDTNDLSRWFSELGKSRCALGEDPAEDVFVSNVQTKDGDYRLIEGVWESAGFYTQRVVNVVATMPDGEPYAPIKRAVRALLVVSDLVCAASGLRRYQLGSEERHAALSSTVGSRASLISRVTISYEQLTEQGTTIADLKPFFLSSERAELLSQEVGLSSLERMPLIAQRDALFVALPTALSAVVRSFVIERLKYLGQADALVRSLANEYSELLADTPIFGGPLRAPVVWRAVGEHRWTSFIYEADRGHIFAFHLFLPSIRAHDDGGLKRVGLLDAELVEKLQSSMVAAEQHFGAKNDFRLGIHVVVGCGWGKGYSAEFTPRADDRWKFESVSAADLVRLSNLSTMTPGHFWRLQAGLDAIRRAGVEIVHVNGVPNLIGWMHQNHGHLVPHAQLPPGRISPDNPLLINPPLNLLREVRADADSGIDRHSVRDNLGAWHDVRHINPAPLFKSPTERGLYSCVDCIDDGRLVALYEGSLCLWVELEAPRIPSRDLQYRLWEMACTWLPRVGVALSARLRNLSVPTLKVRLIFEDNQASIDSIETTVALDFLALCSTQPDEEPGTRKAIFAAGFMSGFRVPANVAERAMVRTLTQAYLELVNEPQAQAIAEELEQLIVTNDDARCFHVMHTHQFSDFIRNRLPADLVEIDALDDATARLGLGWRVEREGDADVVEGRTACTVYLNGIVSELVRDVMVGLGRFNRLATLHRLLLNCESAHSQEFGWTRTSAAVIGLHGSAPDSIRAVVGEFSRLAGASVMSRVLSEIALCACPLEGGIVPADLELSALMARAALLVRYGGLSDAIHYNALTPKLKISPLGDIMFRDDFGNTVVEPMLAQAIGDSYVSSAPEQRKYYAPPEDTQIASSRLDDQFANVWKIEMGFDFDQARTIIDFLEDAAIRDETPVLRIRRSEYFSLAKGKVTEPLLRRFLEQFSLIPRPRWDKVPVGIAGKDIYPWRFGRRLSLVARPVLQVDTAVDPLLLVAPGLLRRGLMYVANGAYRGTLDRSFFQSDEMRNAWLGRASEGHSFNQEVAQHLNNAGWVVRENVGLPEVLRKKLERDFGDVDVLAWRPGADRVLVIECKDLSFARNYSEIAATLSEYQGQIVNGTPDKLRRHLDRFELLQANVESVRRLTGLSSPSLVSCLVVSGIVPMQYAKIDALAHTFVGGIEALLQTH